MLEQTHFAEAEDSDVIATRTRNLSVSKIKAAKITTEDIIFDREMSQKMSGISLLLNLLQIKRNEETDFCAKF